MKWRARSEAAQVEPVVYREEPAQRYTSIETEVAVPALQALVVSLAWALLAGLAAGLLAQPLGWRWWMIPIVVLVVAAVLFALQVTHLINERRELLWKREEIEGRDLDGDGIIGPPPTTTRVEIVDKSNNRIRYVGIPLSDDELSRLARAVMVKRVGFSRRNLADAGALVEEKYTAVIDPMLKGGLLTYRGAGPNSGLALTPSGRAFLKQYLGQ